MNKSNLIVRVVEPSFAIYVDLILARIKFFAGSLKYLPNLPYGHRVLLEMIVKAMGYKDWYEFHVLCSTLIEHAESSTRCESSVLRGLERRIVPAMPFSVLIPPECSVDPSRWANVNAIRIVLEKAVPGADKLHIKELIAGRVGNRRWDELEASFLRSRTTISNKEATS